MIHSPQEIVDLFGGVQAMARVTGIPATTIRSWIKEGAIGGRKTAQAWGKILDGAQKLGLSVALSDLLDLREALSEEEYGDSPRTKRDWVRVARTLSEAVPYIQRYAGKTVVIKYGGHAMGDGKLAEKFARDVVLMKQVGINPVIVHGGGPQIGAMLDRLRIKSSFVAGLRVTDRATVEIVEMVLSGSINKQIVNLINRAGGHAVGLSGKDCNLVQARKVTRTLRDPESNIEQVLDLGFVGEPDHIDPYIIESFRSSDVIPVISPIAFSAEGDTLNVNADTMAGDIAAALQAKRLLLLTDVPGVLDDQGVLIADMTAERARELIGGGTISGGMIPKVETCLKAVSAGTEGAVIIDGRVPHALLLECFTEAGAGTIIAGPAETGR